MLVDALQALDGVETDEDEEDEVITVPEELDGDVVAVMGG